MTVGYAGRGDGRGLAFAMLGDAAEARGRLLRVEFACRALPALQGRDIAYAALAAVVDALLARGMRRAELCVADARLVRDVAERAALPAALHLPYVVLGCRLNRLREVRLAASDAPLAHELTARARAELELTAAA
ncbi:MAG: hypothetical protein ACREM2_05745 [Vulcanimicrobiaceae bacterium]